MFQLRVWILVCFWVFLGSAGLTESNEEILKRNLRNIAEDQHLEVGSWSNKTLYQIGDLVEGLGSVNITHYMESYNNTVISIQLLTGYLQRSFVNKIMADYPFSRGLLGNFNCSMKQILDLFIGLEVPGITLSRIQQLGYQFNISTGEIIPLLNVSEKAIKTFSFLFDFYPKIPRLFYQLLNKSLVMELRQTFITTAKSLEERYNRTFESLLYLRTSLEIAIFTGNQEEEKKFQAEYTKVISSLPSLGNVLRLLDAKVLDLPELCSKTYQSIKDLLFGELLEVCTLADLGTFLELTNATSATRKFYAEFTLQMTQEVLLFSDDKFKNTQIKDLQQLLASKTKEVLKAIDSPIIFWRFNNSMVFNKFINTNFSQLTEQTLSVKFSLIQTLLNISDQNAAYFSSFSLVTLQEIFVKRHFETIQIQPLTILSLATLEKVWEGQYNGDDLKRLLNESVWNNFLNLSILETERLFGIDSTDKDMLTVFSSYAFFFGINYTTIFAGNNIGRDQINTLQNIRVQDALLFLNPEDKAVYTYTQLGQLFNANNTYIKLFTPIDDTLLANRHLTLLQIARNHLNVSENNTQIFYKALNITKAREEMLGTFPLGKIVSSFNISEEEQHRLSLVRVARQVIDLLSNASIKCMAFQSLCLNNSLCADYEDAITCSCDPCHIPDENASSVTDGSQCKHLKSCADSDRNGCIDNPTCSSIDGSCFCQCKSGYIRNGSKCLEQTVCERNKDICGLSAKCITTSGRDHQCICNGNLHWKQGQCIGEEKGGKGLKDYIVLVMVAVGVVVIITCVILCALRMRISKANTSKSPEINWITPIKSTRQTRDTLKPVVRSSFDQYELS